MISGEEAYSRYILWIRPESLERWNLTDGFSICEEQNAYLLKRNRYDRSELMGLLQRLEKTETEKEYGWEALKEALFIEIATQVSRAAKPVAMCNRVGGMIPSADEVLAAIKKEAK